MPPCTERSTVHARDEFLDTTYRILPTVQQCSVSKDVSTVVSQANESTKRASRLATYGTPSCTGLLVTSGVPRHVSLEATERLNMIEVGTQAPVRLHLCGLRCRRSRDVETNEQSPQRRGSSEFPLHDAG